MPRGLTLPSLATRQSRLVALSSAVRSAVPPALRTDIVDVYIFRQWPDEAISRGDPYVELFQLFRSRPPLADTWQPVMGHVREGETAVQCALREAEEETGLSRGEPGFVGLWALEQVNPYFIAELDAVVMSPRFALEVSGAWRPRLNGEHRDQRWIPAHQAARYFMWPGQLASVREITGSLLRPGSLALDPLRVS
jgi:8-oxo-dGTP pyrophosphatase MutT (NUDIX family)